MISIVCASNNKEVLNNMLIKSLNNQTYSDYELIVVDAKVKGFKSAAETLNYGFSQAKGDIVVFIHQDVEFSTNDALEKIFRYSNENIFGIAGNAGAIGDKEYLVTSSVIMGDDHRQAGRKLTEVMECYAVDEVMMIVKKDNFVGFDDLGNTWHLYGPEYSARCLKRGEKVLLFPIELYHASDAKSLDKTYFDTVVRYCKKNKDIKLVRTCCGYFKNNAFIGVYATYRKFKLKVKKLLKRR